MEINKLKQEERNDLLLFMYSCLRSYVTSSKKSQSVVKKMLKIAGDSKTSNQERVMAINTIIDALFISDGVDL